MAKGNNPSVKKDKKKKVRHKTFYIINIKLESPGRKGAIAYLEILERAYKLREQVKIRGEHYGVIRQLFHDKINNHAIHGSFCRYTKISDDDWINLRNLKLENQEIPKDKYPNSKDIEFYFFPDLHRFAIPRNPIISINGTFELFRSVLMNAIGEDEKLSVFLEQSDDVIKRILEAKKISHIHIEVTPTNGDNTKEAEEFMDDELRNAGISHASADFQSVKGANLSLIGKVIPGLLAVAQNYGSAKAVITNEDGKTEKIDTSMHPREHIVEYRTEDDIQTTVYSMLRGRYRDGEK